MSFNLKAKLSTQLDLHMKEVVRGAGITFFIKVISAGFAFGFNLILARFFGVEATGIYFLSLTLVTITATISRSGLENTLLRFIAAHSVKKEWPQVKGVFQKGMLLNLTVSVFLSSCLFLSAPWLTDQVFKKPDLLIPLRLMSLAVMPLSLFWNLGEALKGLKCIRDSQIIQGLGLPLLGCIGLTLLRGNGGVVGVAWVYLIAACTVLIGGFLLWRKATPQLIGVVGSFPFRTIFHSCIPLLWVQIMSLLMQWSSILLLGVWAGKSEVGVFGAASRTAMLTSLILVSVNSIVAPKFAALYELGDLQGLALMARNSTKLMTALAVPILLVFILFPNFVMGLFGSDFSIGGKYLAILSVGQFINVSTGSVGYLLMMTGNERIIRNNTILAGGLILLLNFTLIPLLGGLGAALATAISLAFQNINAVYLAYKKLGILTIPFGKS